MSDERSPRREVNVVAERFVEMMAEAANIEIEVALRPVLARIEALEQQVAELRGESVQSETPDDSVR